MTSKILFTSISSFLDAVQKQINIQAGLIVDSWGTNGGEADHIGRVVHHLLDKPGKMLRPALVLLSAGMVGWDPPAAAESLSASLTKLATAVELIHSASLIHDDIIDGEESRRGQSALHRKHGNQTAVLVGDILYAQSFSLITSLELPSWDQHLEIFRLYCDTTRNMCLGEIIEQRTIDEKLTLDFPAYLNILKNKTAVLMSASCRSGSILAGANKGLAEKLGDFGMAFGLAFQLLDDHKDHDCLIGGNVDIVAKALQQMGQAREILDHLNDSVYRTELIRACDFVTEAVRVTTR
jgi:geranylgeranyl pyrophosphate synthase